MVSVLSFYSDNPSSNPTVFSENLCLKRIKINKKRTGRLIKKNLEYSKIKFVFLCKCCESTISISTVLGQNWFGTTIYGKLHN